MLNQYLVIVLSAILITYMLYTFAPTAGEHNYMMMFTIPFVIYGIFRYMEILQSKDTGAAPEEVLLSDRPPASHHRALGSSRVHHPLHHHLGATMPATTASASANSFCSVNTPWSMVIPRLPFRFRICVCASASNPPF